MQDGLQIEGSDSGIRNLRVLYSRTHYWFGLTHGGSVAHTAGVLNALDKQTEVEVIGNERLYGVEQIPHTIVPPIGRGWRGELLYNLKFRHHLIAKIRRFKPDFVYHRYNGYSFATASVCRALGVPLVLEFNSSHIWKAENWSASDLKTRLSGLASNLFLQRIEPFNLGSASIIVVVSEALKHSLMAVGISPERILVNPNGVDPNKFKLADSALCSQIKRDLNMPQNRLVVGFAGTFGPWHGIPELTEAILRIKSSPKWADRVCLVLYGRPSPLRAEMERQVQHLEDVIFAGSIEFEKISDYLSICDILLSPHGKPVDGREFFGSPTKLYEYMSLEKGIVASNLGQIGTVLKHMDTAYLCAPGNVDELVEGIEYFLEHPEEITRMGQNARAVVLAAHTWDHNVSRTIEAFREFSRMRESQYIPQQD